MELYFVEREDFNSYDNSLKKLNELLEECKDTFDRELHEYGYCYIDGKTGIPVSLLAKIWGD